MSTEQKQLLYDIASWHSRQFYNNMKDTWAPEDYSFDHKCDCKIAELEKQYAESYGDPPEWEYIDDVWAAMRALEQDLKEA